MPLYDAFGKVIPDPNAPEPVKEPKWGDEGFEWNNSQIGYATAYARGMNQASGVPTSQYYSTGYRNRPIRRNTPIYADELKIQLNLGLIQGCRPCEGFLQPTVLTASTWNRNVLTHLRSSSHIQNICGTKSTEESLALLQFAIHKPEDDLLVDDAQEPSFGWRGFFLQDWEGQVVLRGAKKQFWHGPTMQAICLGTQGNWDQMRRACLEHIEWVPGRADELTIREYNGQFSVDEIQNFKPGSCSPGCGIYGYADLERLYQENISDKFDCLAFVAGYGSVNEDADHNFKASDVKIVKLFVKQEQYLANIGAPQEGVGDAYSKQWSPYISSKTEYNWNGLMLDLSAKFRCPVVLVKNDQHMRELMAQEHEQWEQEQGLVVPEWLDFTKKGGEYEVEDFSNPFSV